MPRVREIVLRMDEDDYDAIQRAIAIRQQIRDPAGVILPSGEGNLAGRIVAEISRDWIEFVEDLNEGEATP
jgi:hypothetical protein